MAMRFSPTKIPGAVIVTPDIHNDGRGFFSRLFCEESFAAATGISLRPCQVNLSHNARAKTLRGLHFQDPPHAEAKLLRCVRGRVFDVALDLRPDSPAYGLSVGIELSEADGTEIFIPAGCAHGFLTLADDTDLLYLMGAPENPAAARGVRWNDPAFAIDWPEEPAIMSERDRNFPDFAWDGSVPAREDAA
jgi:dTDP-4-dehydrorhamnose 3,5-epimerase